jgi:hypothetical protein
LFLVDERKKAYSEKCTTPLSPEKMHPRAVFTVSAAKFKKTWF